MRYYIAGNRGLVGNNYSKFSKDNYGGNTDTVDYTDYQQTYDDINQEDIATHVIINAATVGGLEEDLDKSFELMLRNLKIQNNLFEACANLNIHRVLLQGSNCSYPEIGNQPFQEEQLFEGKPYDGYITTALPKLIGMYQCKASNDKRNTRWRTAINTNMFGPMDRTGKYAHVIGALMKKFVLAMREDYSEIEIWGSGDQTRDLLYIKDAIRAMDIILNNDIHDTVNVASGVEMSIKEIIEIIKNISGFSGRFNFNTDKPEGIKNRAICNKRLLSLGWMPEYDIREALEETYGWFYDNIK